MTVLVNRNFYKRIIILTFTGKSVENYSSEWRTVSVAGSGVSGVAGRNPYSS